MRHSIAGSQSTPSSPAAELSTALASCRGAFIATGLISGMSNILMLTGAIFMLQVYDRVLPSRSVSTLIGLAILASRLRNTILVALISPGRGSADSRHKRKSAERDVRLSSPDAAEVIYGSVDCDASVALNRSHYAR